MTTKKPKAKKKAAPKKKAPAKAKAKTKAKAKPKAKPAAKKRAKKEPPPEEVVKINTRDPGKTIGNNFYLMRSSHGRHPIFNSPEELWNCCVEYFDWVESNPLEEEKAFSYEGVAFTHIMHKMRPMTLDGLATYLDICRATWDNYRKREGFLGVVRRVERIVRDQKFAGAAAGLLNSNLITRDLGLADKLEAELANREGEAFTTENIHGSMDDHESLQLYKAGLKRAASS